MRHSGNDSTTDYNTYGAAPVNIVKHSGEGSIWDSNEELTAWAVANR